MQRLYSKMGVQYIYIYYTYVHTYTYTCVLTPYFHPAGLGVVDTILDDSKLLPMRRRLPGLSSFLQRALRGGASIADTCRGSRLSPFLKPLVSREVHGFDMVLYHPSLEDTQPAQIGKHELRWMPFSPHDTLKLHQEVEHPSSERVLQLMASETHRVTHPITCRTFCQYQWSHMGLGPSWAWRCGMRPNPFCKGSRKGRRWQKRFDTV